MAVGDGKRIGEEVHFMWPEKNTATSRIHSSNGGYDENPMMKHIKVGGLYRVSNNYAKHSSYGAILQLEFSYVENGKKKTNSIWVSADSCRSTLDPNLPEWF